MEALQRAGVPVIEDAVEGFQVRGNLKAGPWACIQCGRDRWRTRRKVEAEHTFVFGAMGDDLR